jgi:VanZ family protein
MLPLRYARTWLVAGLVLLALGLVSALSPVPSVLPLTLNDKLIHMAGFLFFMLWFGGVFEVRFAPVVVVALSAYGLLIELLQSLTPTRQAETLDLIADVSGVLLGWVLSAAGLSRWCVKLESWLVRPSP